MKNRKIIKVEVPKEIWDAEMSIWNMFANRDIFGAWMKSIQKVVNQMGKKYKSVNNKRYNQIINEAYENYKMAIQNQKDLQRKEVQRLRSQGKWVKDSRIELLSKEEFINKCITDIEFSERWELKIEERELSLEERSKIWDETHNPVGNIYTHNQYNENNIPNKLITITYKDEKIKIYE